MDESAQETARRERKLEDTKKVEDVRQSMNSKVIVVNLFVTVLD